MNSIKTSRVLFVCDRKVLASKYRIFRIDTSEKYFADGYRILDDSTIEGTVASVSISTSNSFYVLGSTLLSREKIKNVVSASDKGYKINWVELNFNEIPDYVLLKLMLNALGRFEIIPSLKCSNLTGRLFLFSPGGLSEDRNQIHALELLVDENLAITLDVRTFTSEKKKKFIEFRKGKSFNSYPQYVIGARNTLRRRLKTDKGICYIQRAMKGAKKAEIPFIDLNGDVSFSSSKMGILQTVFATFNRIYSSFANIGLAEMEIMDTISLSKSDLKENKQHVKACLKKYSPRLIDRVDTESSYVLVEKLINLAMDEYGIDIPVGKRMSSKGVNIRLILEKEKYDEGLDEYRATDDKYIVQNITYENFGSNPKYSFRTLFHELVIKEDLRLGEITLYDWRKLGLTGDVVFGCNFPDEEGFDQFIFMTIHTDGHFCFERVEGNMLFYPDKYQKAIMLFSLCNKTEKVEGIVIDSNGNAGIIIDTGIFTIPEIDKIKERLVKGDTYLRGKEARKELLSASVDIHRLSDGNKEYYHTGIIGAGMQAKVIHASHIRRIIDEKGNEISIRNLLPLMDVCFVRNMQLTVLPFPFKYLREYQAQIKQG